MSMSSEIPTDGRVLRVFVDRVLPALTGIGGFFTKEKHPVAPVRTTAKPIKSIMVMTMKYMLFVFDLWLRQAEGALVDL